MRADWCAAICLALQQLGGSGRRLGVARDAHRARVDVVQALRMD
jgi:hypothetical protein